MESGRVMCLGFVLCGRSTLVHVHTRMLGSLLHGSLGVDRANLLHYGGMQWRLRGRGTVSRRCMRAIELL